MNTRLNVLIVEDVESDAELVLEQLRRGGYDPVFHRVDTAAGMNEALDTKSWDIIISDYAMPTFSGLAAVAILRARGLDIPFILVSGTIGEEVAVEAMRA